MFHRLRSYLDKRKAIREAGSFDEQGLIVAVEEGKREALAILLAAGIDPNARSERGVPALSRAVERENLPVLRMLIEAGASIDATDTQGRTALMKAIDSGNKHIFDHLMDQGPELEIADATGETALFKAVRLGNTTMTRRLIQEGAEVDLRNRDGFTPLLLAAEYQRTGIVKALLQAGADPSRPDPKGRTILERNHLSPRLAKMLRQAGADSPREDTPLGRALPLLPVLPMPMLSRLLTGAVQGIAQALHNESPYEAQLRGSDLFRLLKTFTTDLTATPGWLPDVIGQLHELTRSVQQLALQRNSNPPAVSDELRQQLDTLLESLSALEQTATPARKPADTPPPPTEQRRIDRALLDAARDGSLPHIELLLQLGADVATHNDEGHTPLHLAVPHPTAVEALLQAGADPRAADRTGRSPIDWALATGMAESLAHMQAHIPQQQSDTGASA
ncbi:MAG: hypothetical protein OHK0039_03290 [Bacteroidia bacterium]